jgi:hypothetical protein
VAAEENCEHSFVKPGQNRWMIAITVSLNQNEGICTEDTGKYTPSCETGTKEWARRTWDIEHHLIKPRRAGCSIEISVDATAAAKCKMVWKS